jgi:hypothetical protein
MNFEAGDILAFYGRGAISGTIEFCTGSPTLRPPFWRRGPSHVGIIWPMYTRGNLLVESTTLCDLVCQVNREKRKGVQFHRPEDRIAAYDGKVSCMRLADGWKIDQAEAEFITGWFWHRRKLAYDARGAICSGTRVLKWTRLLPVADLGSQFCSELCAAALMRIGRLPVDNPTVYNPASLVARLQRSGIYGPLEPLSTVPSSALSAAAGA